MPSFLPILSYSNGRVDSGKDLTSHGVDGMIAVIDQEQNFAKKDRVLNEKVKDSHGVSASVDRNDSNLKQDVQKVSDGIYVNLNGDECPPKQEVKKIRKKKRETGKNVVGKASPKLESRTTGGDGATSKDTGGQQNEALARAKAQSQAVKAVKKAVLDVQLLLLDRVENMPQLQAASAILTQNEYADVVTERSIAKQCGFPLCRNPLLSDDSRKGRYRISLPEHKVYDLRETRLYCCSRCLVASKTFSVSLCFERDGIIESEKLLQIVNAVRGVEVPDDVQKDNRLGGEKDLQLLRVQERHERAVSSFDQAGPSHAVDGYTPRHRPSSRGERSKEPADLTGVNFHHESLRDVAGEASAELIRRRLDEAAKLGSLCKVEPVELSPAVCNSHSSPLVSYNLKQGAEIKILGSAKLRSALKKTNSQGHRRSISWVEQRNEENRTSTPEPIPQAAYSNHGERTVRTTGSVSGSSVKYDSDFSQVVESSTVSKEINHETETNKRLFSAETLAAALAEAAEAVASGKVGGSEAVSEAGLSIVPATTRGGILLERSSETLEQEPSREADVQWPECKSKEVEDEIDYREGWNDIPPEGFKLEISKFGTIWMALEEWISASTIAHIYGKGTEAEEEFQVVNGREYRRQLHESRISAEICKTFSGCISRVVPDVIMALQLNLSVSTVEQAVGRLVRSMNFEEALPAFDSGLWRMIVLLLFDALAVQRLSGLGSRFAFNKELVCKVLKYSGTSEDEYESFLGLLLPLGRVPQ